jgi:hypothetical protein
LPKKIVYIYSRIFNELLLFLLPKWILKNKRIIEHSLKCQTWEGTTVLFSH